MINFSSISLHSGLGRVLRGLLRWIPKKTVVPILQVPMRGRRWIIGAGAHGCWLGTYETITQRAICDLLRPGMVFSDVGANVGFHSLLASGRVGPTGRVVAFEPLPENVEFCERIFRINHADNAQVVKAAVADFVGQTQFAEGSNRAEGSLRAGGTLCVEVESLDHWLEGRGCPDPDGMKIDVEGAELSVLKGAANMITRKHPAIVLSTHGTSVHADCCDWLRSVGYNIRSLDERPVETSNELIAVAA